MPKISERRIEITKMVEQGFSNKDIVSRLGNEYNFELGFLHKYLSSRGLKANVDNILSKDTRIRNKKIIEMHKKGYGAKSIAKRIGCCKNTVKRVLRNNGKDVQKFWKIQKKSILERRESIRSQGICHLHNLKEVGELFGVGRETISSDIMSLGKEYQEASENKVKDRILAEHKKNLSVMGKESSMLTVADKLGLTLKKVRAICGGKKCTREKKRYSKDDIYFKQKCSRIARSAKRRGMDFFLTPEHLKEVREIQGGDCAYTGNPLDRDCKDFKDIVTLDRIINDGGYVNGNVCFTTRRVNAVKNDMTLQEMKERTPLFYNNISKFLQKLGGSDISDLLNDEDN